MSMLGKVKDYPAIVTSGVAGGVGVHWLLYDSVGWFPDVAGRMAGFDDAWQVYLGFAGVVAVAAGFAGVIIVFALSSTTDPFRKLRLRAGRRLEANWISPTAVCLGAAFGAVGCSVVAGIGYGLTAWWVFEFLLILSATSGLRLLWLMRTVIQLVRSDDEKSAQEPPRTVSLAEVIDHPKRA